MFASRSWSTGSYREKKNILRIRVRCDYWACPLHTPLNPHGMCSSTPSFKYVHMLTGSHTQPPTDQPYYNLWILKLYCSFLHILMITWWYLAAVVETFFSLYIYINCWQMMFFRGGGIIGGDNVVIAVFWCGHFTSVHANSSPCP